MVKIALPMQGCRTRISPGGGTWIPQAEGHGQKRKKKKKNFKITYNRLLRINKFLVTLEENEDGTIIILGSETASEFCGVQSEKIERKKRADFGCHDAK